MKSSVDTTLKQDEIRGNVRSRYGEIAREGTSCCGPETRGMSCCNSADDTREAAGADRLGYTPEDLAASPSSAETVLGCGNPTAIASIQPGETVLDLGSGAGFDCFIASRQVGPGGQVIGVDMTPDMLSAARQNAHEQNLANVEFRLGEIEALPVADGSVDVIMSNCVINLSPDKPAVFREAARVLKKGGRLSIADIVASRPIPEEMARDFASFTGCVSGAAQIGELQAMLEAAGFGEVTIKTNEASREMINGWSPGGRAGDYVVSALIEARK